MSYFEDASLVLIPSGIKDQKVYSIKPTDGSGDLTFSRGSDIEATRVNANGYIEKAQVNLLLQSNSFDTTWITNFVSLSGGQSGYDGSSDAWEMTDTRPIGDGSWIYQSISQTGILNFSFYAKAGTQSFLRCLIIGTGSATLWVDLTDGSISNETDVIDSSATSVGGGWYRISFSGNVTASAVRIQMADGAGSSSSTLGATTYIQDAQLNYGLVAQTYQETTTAAVVSGITDNMPRLSYDPANPTCPSLLLEPSRQNKFEHSEYFGASYWTKNNATITDNATTSPEGVVNAAALTENSSTSTHFMQPAQVVASASTYYSASYFVKYNGRHFQIVGSTGSEGGGYVNFDLVNGVVGSSDQLTGTIENYGGGWYRCTGTNISTSSATEIRLLPYLITSPTSARAESYAGNGTSGVYLYGAQMEEARYQSSMVPTYGSSATRTAENALSLTNTLGGLSAGTFFIEMSRDGIDAAMTGSAISLRDNAGAEEIRLHFDAPTSQVRWRDGNNSFAQIGGALSITAGTTFKILVKTDGTTAKAFGNGAQLGSNYSVVSAFDFQRIYNYELGYRIKQQIFFPTALSDSDCIALTSL